MREVSRERSVDVVFFFLTVDIVNSVRSFRSGHNLQEIRLVKNIGIISKTVICFVMYVVGTAVNNEQVL